MRGFLAPPTARLVRGAVKIQKHLFNQLHTGQRWYSFGWESQLLETALLGALAAPGVAGSLATMKHKSINTEKPTI